MNRPPDILFLFEDALRYDAYRHTAMAPVRDVLSPWCEYDNWYAVSNCTDPNMASMLTGMYPWEHGLRRMGQNYTEPTILDTLRDSGYTTIYAGWRREWVERSCDLVWSYYSPGRIAEKRVPTSEEAKKLMLRARRPWFCFIRHMWCHARYEHPNYYASVRRTADDLLHLVRWVREHFPETLIILTADHGEMLQKDRKEIDASPTPPQHAWGLFEPLVHVPMVISHAGCGNTVEMRYYQHPDLYDIIMGMRPKPKEYMKMEGTGVDSKFAALYHRGVIHKGAKLIYGGAGNNVHAYLYLTGSDGWIDETHNVARAFPDLVKRLLGHLPPPIDYTPEEEAAVLARLEELGYGT